MIDFNRHKLDNGLTLLHHYDGGTRMVAVNLLYNVGSSDEKLPLTGLAHLLEHLMFTGSEHIVNYDSEMQAAGGENNAWTSPDGTNYYDVLPAQNLETALWLESDRLMSLTLSDESITAQKSVVIEEFKQRCLNVPYGDISHLMCSLAYKHHPYQWPTIGRAIEDIEAATATDVRQFHSEHYAVNNLILCISGNVSWERALQAVEKWFGDIPARPIAPRCHTPEPLQTQPRLLQVERAVPQTIVYRGYHMCARAHSDYPACDLLSDVLGNGKSARFYRNLVLPTGLFTELDASVGGTLDDGLFYVRGKLASGVSVQHAQEAIDSELERLFTTPVSEYELQKFVNKHISNSRFDSLGYLQQAMRLSQYEQIGDARLEGSEEQLYRQVTTDDLQRCAQQILKPENCCTVLYVASGK